MKQNYLATYTALATLLLFLCSSFFFVAGALLCHIIILPDRAKHINPFGKGRIEKNVKRDYLRERERITEESCPRQVSPHPVVAVWSITQRHGRENDFWKVIWKMIIDVHFIEKEDQHTTPLSNTIGAKISTTNCRAESREWGGGGGESYKSKIRSRNKSRNWKRSRRASFGVSTLVSRIAAKWVKIKTMRNAEFFFYW